MEFYSITDGNDWNKILNKMELYDFYQTYEYHNIDCLNTKNEPLGFYFKKNEFEIFFPFIKRNIINTNYFDLTSTYGYAGPLITNSDSIHKADGFKQLFDCFCKENNIVSCFSRLHPLIGFQEKLLYNIGEIIPLNTTVSIDLTLSDKEQWSIFRKSTKYDINKLNKMGVKIVESNKKSEINEFIKIYNNNMNRVNANKSYYFSNEYYYNFINKINSKLLLAKYNNEIIAGAIFTFTKNIMQYHLAGTKSEFLKIAPMKLILNEARLIGNNMNIEYLHLGGGVNGENDDLYKFKSGFSNSLFTFKVWRNICDINIYNNIVKARFGNTIPKTNFFPLYRY